MKVLFHLYFLPITGVHNSIQNSGGYDSVNDSQLVSCCFCHKHWNRQVAPGLNLYYLKDEGTDTIQISSMDAVD